MAAPSTSPTPLVTVRRAAPADADALARVYAGPRAYGGTLQLPFPTPETWRKRLAEPPEGTFQLVACAGDEVVGNLGLYTLTNNPRRRHVGQIGMAVRDDWQGRGVGSALMAAAVDLADNWLNLQRLELDVYTDNAAAIRLYEKFGFDREGVLRGFAFREGRFVDAYLMARVKSLPRDAG